MAISANLPGHVVMDHQAGVLDRVRDKDTNLAVWLRGDDGDWPRIAAWLDALETSQIPNQRMIVSRQEMPASIREACEATLPEAPEREAIIADLISLSHGMYDFAGKELLKIRLDRIDGPACTRFHHDAVGVRMLCTYRGPGTEWVPDDAVLPGSLGRSLPNPQIVPEASTVARRLPRFAVGYLKGSNARDGTWGIVHRSPDARPRMLFCIEPPSPRLLQRFLSDRARGQSTLL